MNLNYTYCIAGWGCWDWSILWRIKSSKLLSRVYNTCKAEVLKGCDAADFLWNSDACKTIVWVKQLLSTDCWNTRVRDHDGQAENFGEYGDRAKKDCKVKVLPATFNTTQTKIRTNNEHKSPWKACGGRRPYWLCSRSHCLDHLRKLAGYRCQVILVDGDKNDGVWWCLNLFLSTILASSGATDIRCKRCRAIHKIATNQLTDYLHPGMTWCQCSKSSGNGWRASTSPKKPRISMSFIQFLQQACRGSS